MESVFVTEKEAIEPKSQAVNPIARVLQGKKGSALEHLVKSCGCKLNKKYNYITDTAGQVIKVSQLFAYHNVGVQGGTRCPKCKEVVSWDLILYHFEDHKMDIKTIYKLFLNDFDQWSYFDSRFTWMGEPISFEKIQ